MYNFLTAQVIPNLRERANFVKKLVTDLQSLRITFAGSHCALVLCALSLGPEIQMCPDMFSAQCTVYENLVKVWIHRGVRLSPSERISEV